MSSTKQLFLSVWMRQPHLEHYQHMLLSQVWGTDHSTHSNYLHVYIGQLRRKIEPDPAHPRFLQTIAGVGYRFSDV